MTPVTELGTPTPVPGVLRGLVGFTAVLRHAGLPVTTERVTAFLTAVDALGAGREQVYRAGLHTLCADPDDLPRYERAFVDWFDDDPRPARARRPRRTAARCPRCCPPATGGGTDGGRQRPAGAGERLGHRGAAPPRPRRAVGHRARAPARPARAAAPRAADPPVAAPVPARRGAADPRRTLRAALRTDGELCVLARRDRSRRPRKVVLLIDVSGSMEPYADALLRFAHVVVRRAPASTEVFTLGTRLTRVTRELRLRDPEHALAAAGRAIPDWSGGTRLGEVLAAFVDRWGRRGAARRAVVVVFSDGWERGDTALLGTQLARLRRLAHRLVWVNPHVGKAGYAPVQGGIVAALPHLDDLLAGHSLATLAESARGDGACVTWWRQLARWWADGEGRARWRPWSAPTVRRPASPARRCWSGPDGEAVGSVSGGCVEGAVYELGQQVRADGRPVLQRYGVSDDDAFAVGPDLRRDHRPVRREGGPRDVPAARRRRRGDREGAAGRRRHGRLRAAGAPRHAARGVAGPGRRAPPARARLDDAVRDDVRGLLDAGRNATLHYGVDGQRRGEGLDVFVESFAPPPRMIVFGAIDFAAAVAKIGSLPRLPGHGLRRPPGLRHRVAVPGRDTRSSSSGRTGTSPRRRRPGGSTGARRCAC